jgi:hypothetical protein
MERSKGKLHRGGLAGFSLKWTKETAASSTRIPANGICAPFTVPSPPVMHERRRAFLWRPSLANLRTPKSWPGFVDYVERCFRRSAEAIEPGRGHNLPNACFTGLGA